MDLRAIASLLQPYAAGLSDAQLGQISTYLDLLLKWNARLNLTAVRDQENIVTRHFGESFFAARRLLPAAGAIDVGSGPGFPGLPMRIYRADLPLVLIESQSKKATFLKEVVRALGLHDVEIFSGRAEDFAGRADLVTLRAVERFSAILPVAAGLVQPGGRLALLIGASQINEARTTLPGYLWGDPIVIPGSASRVVLAGQNLRGQ